MLKEKLTEITKTLSYLTDKKLIVWKEQPSSFNRNYRRTMISQGEDGTNYELEVKFVLRDDKWTLEEDSNLWIKNPLLPDSVMFVNNYKSDGETMKLKESILKNYCSDMTPSLKDVELTLDSIAKGINISEFREGKLNKILK